MPRFFIGLAAAFFTLRSLAIPVTGLDVSDYSPGDATANFQNPNVATGNLNGDTTFGGLNPFNPAVSPNDIVIAGRAGGLTVHLSRPIPTNGINLGIYANPGLIDISNGVGQADNPATGFGSSRAVVSISQDGVNFAALNGGAPITFTNPTNYYTDQPISGFFQALGVTHSSQSKPFLGNLASFNGQNYSQVKTTLNNSAGGTWLDLRGTPMYSVNYVRFAVADIPGERMVVDAIGGLGAVNTLTATSRVISEDVGVGVNTSHVIVDFGPQSYDFAVHYNGSITGEDAMNLLAANTDLRFGFKHFSFGDFRTSIDYGGYVDTGDGALGTHFWSYWVGDGNTWALGPGFSSRTLTDGSYEGWVWRQAQSTSPDFAVVPEPATGLFIAAAAMIFIHRRRR